jgi:two-component system, LytTR family, sensor kinase
MLTSHVSRGPIAQIGQLVVDKSKASATNLSRFTHGYRGGRCDNGPEAFGMNFFRPVKPLLKGWLLSFAGWGLVSFILGVNFVHGNGVPWTNALSAGLRDQLPWAILTPLVFRFATRFPVDRLHWKKTLAPHLIICALVIWGIHLWKDYIDPGPAPHPVVPPETLVTPAADKTFEMLTSTPPKLRPPRPAIDWFHFASVELPIYILIVSAAHTLNFYRRAELRAGQLAAARLRTLQTQFRPHFLFNTLNTIAGLVHKAPDKADSVLTMLSDLLRFSLETNIEAQIPLKRELEFVEKYLAIMHVRFEERVRYEVQAAPDALTASVPTLLLQPIVENSVKYGLEPKREGGKITIRAWRDARLLHLNVSDTGVGITNPEKMKEGIGLSSTRARLHEFYGGAASLTIRDGNGTTVEITIPFRSAA